MWLIIREKDGAVLGTNCNCAPPAPQGCIVKEWYGAEPPCHDPMEGIESYDPTIGVDLNDLRRKSALDRLSDRVDELAQQVAVLTAINERFSSVL